MQRKPNKKNLNILSIFNIHTDPRLDPSLLRRTNITWIGNRINFIFNIKLVNNEVTNFD